MRISDWSSDVCSSDLLRNTGKGWVTAEYGMLPRATHTRGAREAARGSQSGRTQEIQRLIGRSLRAVTNMERSEERRGGKECVSTCRSRWWPYHLKNKYKRKKIQTIRTQK